jgi:hypothetical protein
VHVQYASCASEALVPATKVDGPNTILAEHGSAHDTGLNCDIEIRLMEYTDGLLGQDACDSNELGVSSAIQCAVGFIHAAANDLAVFDKHTSDWSLVALECKLSLLLTMLAESCLRASVPWAVQHVRSESG